MKLFRSNLKLNLGFLVILVMLLMVLGLWVKDTRSNAHRIEHISELQLRSHQVAIMRDVVLQRMISLHRMAATTDPFDRDDEFMHYRALAQDFLRVRALLNQNNTHKVLEAVLWERLTPLLTANGEIQSVVADYILDDKLPEANHIMVGALYNKQSEVIEILNELLVTQKDHIVAELTDTITHRADTYLLIASLGVITLALIVFMVYVLRSTGKTQREYIAQSRKIRDLYEVSSSPGTTVPEKILQILRMGCEFLELSTGQVTRYLSEDNSPVTIYSYSRPGSETINLRLESVLHDLCQVAVWRRDILAVQDISSTSLLPEHQMTGACIAVPLEVNGLPYGLVRFFGSMARKRPFSEEDMDLIKLIAAWVSMSLERLDKERELEEARDMSEAANRIKSGFLANMSHELRTPLNAIIGYSEMLSELTQESLGGEYVQDLNNITKSGRHLLSLINDILDVSKIEAGKIELSMSDFNVDMMLGEVCSTVAPVLAKNFNHFKVVWDGVIDTIYGDPIRVRQILINLLSNAGKFCRDGQVTLRISVDGSQGGGRLVFAVEDTGMGIESAKIAKLFRPFSQLNSDVAGEFGGTGLGLVISKRLANLMDGDIEVQSHPGKLTIFSFWIPALSREQVTQQRLLQQAQTN